MPKPRVEAETARLGAGIPVQVYDQMQRAALYLRVSTRS